MRYILLFIAIFTFSCKYNISSPVGTIKDYSANSGKLFYTSSDSSADDIETTLKKNKHSLGIYKIVVLGGDSTTILTNIKEVLNKNPSFDNVEIDLSQTKMTNIPKDMFTNTTNLGKITLPDTVTNIGESAFSGCSSLSYIRFSGGLTNIGTNAFSNCSALTVLLLPDGLKTIEKCAFSDCSSLKDLFFPASLTNIGSNAFSNCIKLVNLEYAGTNSSSLSSSSNLFSSSSPTNLYLPNVETGKTNDFTNFLGKNWNGNIYAKKHIPS
ncbi:leucine-rich repeat domain-containing protein [Brachyspira aalborgi]|uniref:Leucine-rich repeat domain-containing protein n=1 Tax=Brachyspira aalborgi TaxID=29522 RepID=A0A5C8F3N1_9SPIR|nr:leucine-rich repeat domain-containing protein [Brachyspira aalborgi]TXJ43812.1 leucine-rich repeat domain-containing protein [Brachyspira aalborgi]